MGLESVVADPVVDLGAELRDRRVALRGLDELAVMIEHLPVRCGHQIPDQPLVIALLGPPDVAMLEVELAVPIVLGGG